MIKKYLVVGAGGMDGSTCIHQLLKRGHYVVGACHGAYLDNLSRCLGDPKFKITSLDISDFNDVKTLIESSSPDYILNFAGVSKLSACDNDPVKSHEVNAAGVLNILESIRQANPNIKFINASSIYSIHPESIYGESKYIANRYCKLYSDKFNIKAISAALTNHTGPYQSNEFVFGKIAQWFRKHEHLLSKNIYHIDEEFFEAGGEVYSKLKLGNIDIPKSFMHADDVVSIMIDLLDSAAEDLVVIASSDRFSVREALEIMFRRFKQSYLDFIHIDKDIIRKKESICYYKPTFQHYVDTDLKFDKKSLCYSIING